MIVAGSKHFKKLEAYLEHVVGVKDAAKVPDEEALKAIAYLVHALCQESFERNKAKSPGGSAGSGK